ncbi:MAG: pyruvate kinase [Clostridia bacterium]|nr:pyruvate kinase [Clostridia bacterium]
MKKDLKKTKIVGTIGPASEHMLEDLFKAGLNVCRVNYSHGSWDEQSEKTEDIIRIRKEMDLPIALLLDMKGPEIRTGMLYTGKNTKIQLKDGQKFTLVNEDITGDEEKVSVTYKELYKDVEPGTKILIDDGAIELKVDEVVGKDIVCTVVHGNGLGSRKTMNLPGTVIRLPGLAEKDIADLKTACEHDYDFVAISFARNLDDIRQVRKVLDENGGKDIQIVTKIENVEGLSNLDDILNEADAQMIARGDMATETDFTEPPIVQKRIIKTSNRICKPAITATQMLESMTHQPLPTRAEASDVANAIYDRTSAIMLSGECAQGDYPLECVQTMSKIAARVEPTINYWKKFDENKNIELNDLQSNIVYSTCVMAKNTKADAIVCYTHSGDTARKFSGMGAGCPILAVTDNRRTFNQLALAWNVQPVFVEAGATIDATVEKGIEKLKSKGILESGDLIVLAGGNQLLNNATESKIVSGVARI